MKKEFLAFVTETDTTSLGFLQKAVSLASEKELIPAAIIVLNEFELEQREAIERVGVEKIYWLRADIDDINMEPTLISTISELVRKLNPEAVLFELSSLSSSVAPAVASVLGLGITADCTEFRWDEQDGLLQIRPTFGGRKIAVNRSVKVPYMATVRRGVFPYIHAREKHTHAELVYINVPEGEKTFEILEFIREIGVNISLTSADIIVSGGLGMGSRENFAKLYELAELLQCAVGASRAAVAAGYANYSHQVGQTGLSVNPKLYIAFGISGAVQHLSGIMNAEKIIAVNNNPKAAIHEYSDYSVIADCNQFIDELIKELKAG